jgi:ABC-2 type transport system permease protein
MITGVGCVAWKEFLHLWRDKRLLLIVLVMPPLITILLGNAFEVTDLKGVPAWIDDRDKTPASHDFTAKLLKDDSFAFTPQAYPADRPELLPTHGIQGVVVIPPGWGDSLNTDKPLKLHLILDGSDTTTAPYLQGEVEKNLGDYQEEHIETLIATLPEDSLNILAQLPDATRQQLKGQSIRWGDEVTIPFNPGLHFIDYVVSGIIGLVLQLVTVTLTSVAIVRERESGSFSQLALTPLHFNEIVLGKILPYFLLSLFLTWEVGMTAAWEFHLSYHNWPLLFLNACLFILFSLSLGLFISAVARTQTQAMQFSVFLLLPIMILSGAFGPLSQLPPGVQAFSNIFPLTHYCHAFRLINIYGAGLSLVAEDFVILFAGFLVLLVASTLLLRRR